jgi:hypothetical protein
VDGAFINVVVGAVGTVTITVLTLVGRKIAKFVGRLQGMAEDYFPVPAHIVQGPEGPITVNPARPGIPGEIAHLGTRMDQVSAGVHELGTTVAEAVRLMELLAHVPDQLGENRRHIEARLERAEQVLTEAARLAGDAATAGARAEQRTEELADLVGAQIEALHTENQGLRSALHELGLDVDLQRPEIS